MSRWRSRQICVKCHNVTRVIVTECDRLVTALRIILHAKGFTAIASPSRFALSPTVSLSDRLLNFRLAPVAHHRLILFWCSPAKLA